MRPRVSIITLGVDDLERALTFYRDGLGLPTRGLVGTEYPHALIEQARRAGAVVTDPPHDAFWGGYTGSFQDPDGHLWEIAWNPEMDPGD